MEGRGRFGYAVTLAGFTRDFAPDQDRRTASALISRRVYYPAAPELDGKVLPTGFGVAVNAEHVREPRQPGRAGRQGPRRAHGAPQHPRQHTGMGARLPGRRGAPARRHDPDRGLGEHQRHVVRAGRRRADLLLRPRPEPGRDLVRRLRLPARPVSRLARFDPERLRAGPLPSRADERAARASSRRAGHRPVQGRRPTSFMPVARPTSTPAGSPRPAKRSSRFSAATRCATTSPRTPPGCCS